MAKGMEMLLGSIGINPEEIKASIEAFKTIAEEVKTRQERVETKLDFIIAQIQSNHSLNSSKLGDAQNSLVQTGSLSIGGQIQANNQEG